MAENINSEALKKENVGMALDETNLRQMQAYELVANTNQSFFLTGRAGTGKTTFLKNIQKLTGKQFIVVAPTGIAAIVAGGVTIHSFFGLELNVLGPKEHGKNFTDEKIKIIRSCDTIIIDEVSMVRCDTIDAIDRTLRLVTKNNFPFGGKQIIFSGDMFQLPPVLRSGAETEAMVDYYGTDVPFFFKAHVFDHLSIPTIEFEKVYRQEDQLFLNILNNVRAGHCSLQDLEELNLRCVSHTKENEPIIALTPFKDKAQKINGERLMKLPGQEFVFVGELDGKFAKKSSDGVVKDENLPAPLNLALKVGAQVMFTRNDSSQRWVNGTLATVEQLAEDSIKVRIGSDVYEVGTNVWESYDYEYDKEKKVLKKEISGTYTQYPLRLAWAITIHKSQGLTFDNMILDLSRGTFAAGQLYVALSRVRSLDGLFLSRPVRFSDIKKDDEVISFAAKFNDDDVIETQLAEGKVLYPYLKRKDYDGVVAKYMEMAIDKLKEGNNRYACILFKKMLNNMIFDNVLTGMCKDMELNPADNQLANFNNAILCLYGGNPERAIGFMDKVLKERKIYEAIFIKARALMSLGRYTDADALNIEMAGLLNPDNGGSGYDMKFFYSYASVNEMIGDPCLGAFQSIVLERPDYMPGHLRFFEAMKKQGRSLVLAKGNELPGIALKFNECGSTEEWRNYLKDVKNTEPNTFRSYMSVVRAQSLS